MACTNILLLVIVYSLLIVVHNNEIAMLQNL